MKTLLLLALLFLSGCTQIIVQKGDTSVKVNTLFKDVGFDELEYHDLTLRKYQSDSDQIKAITPYGIVESE